MTRPSDRPLTARQQEVLRAIGGYVHTHGFAPSYAEIRDLVDIYSTSTVKLHVDALQAAGMLTREPGSRRSLALTEAGKLAAWGSVPETCPVCGRSR